MKNLFCIFLIIFLYGNIHAEGKIIEAKSSAYKDVLTAVTQAQNGDTVTVPAGKSTWNNNITFKKGIRILGAGKDKTVINKGSFIVKGNEGNPFRISGFAFNGGYKSFGAVLTIKVQGTCKNFRIDNCKFISDNCHNSVYAFGYTYGVIDHCDFLNGRVLVMELQGHESWKRPLSLGTENAVYIEDCFFLNDTMCNAVDANGGGRYVFRHNTLVNSHCEAHGLQNRNMRGVFSYEIYNNTFKTIDNGKRNWVAIYVHGGTGVFFNNVVLNEGGDPFIRFCTIQNNRSCSKPNKAWGYCDGTSECDGNTKGMSGYPCLDQIGRSTDAGPDKIHPQALEPLYAWNNSVDGAKVKIAATPCGPPEHVKEGRDYFNKKRPDYTPYTYPHPLVTEE